MTTRSSTGEIYQIKVTLSGTEPPIWRRLLVPADLTLAGLHNVLQSAMGWDDSHPHEFRIGRQGYAELRVNEGGFDTENLIDESTVRLHEVLGRVRAKAVYIYDFGDDWNHAVAVEKRLPADPNVTYPVCIGGERACPPEDCGGIPGFYLLLEAIQDPNHKFHEEQLEWLGEEYDPEAFSVEAVNRTLYGRRKRTRQLL
jgi:Plasmid pRiA4b ORF-3-like protein